MDKNQKSMEGVVRDYQAKRRHGLTDKYIRGTVKLEYQGRIIAKRRYCTRTHRKSIVQGWRDEYQDIGSMVLIIEPDNWG